MNYRIKKYNAKLDEWYVCNKLGITHKDWLELATGKKNLANDKLDKFIELTDIKRQEYINQNDEKRKIDEWFDKTTYDDFRKLMESFKVKSRDISRITGYDAGILSTTINKKYISENVKATLYYYFNDENNRRNEYSKEKPKTRVKIIKEGIEVSDNEETPIASVTKPTITSFSEPIDTITLTKAFDLPTTLNKTTMLLTSFVKKEDYDRVVKEKNQAEEELARYKYLIDLLMSK